MPELWPEGTEWDEHTTWSMPPHTASAANEIDQMIANGPEYRRNKRGRSADYLAVGVTDGGRRDVVAVEWRPATRRTRPITAWEA